MQINLFKPKVREPAVAAVGEVLRSGWIGMGARTQEFERAFAEYVGAPHCVALNNCTSALHLAVRLLDLPPGTEVVTTAVTFIATNLAITLRTSHAGVRGHQSDYRATSTRSPSRRRSPLAPGRS